MLSGATDAARALILIGLLVAGCGALWLFVPKLPWLGRLPGDLLIQREGMTIYIPLATSLVVSLLASLAWWLLGRAR